MSGHPRFKQNLFRLNKLIMGISGLLPVLKPTHRQVHLKDYHGKSIAVDGYVWLHKAAFGCALDLCTGKETRKYVDFCMRKTNDLIDNGIWPIIVFDGNYIKQVDTFQTKWTPNKSDEIVKGS